MLEPADKLARTLPPVLVVDADGRVGDIERRGIGIKEHLHDRRDDERDARARVAERRKKSLMMSAISLGGIV